MGVNVWPPEGVRRLWRPLGRKKGTTVGQAGLLSVTVAEAHWRANSALEE